MCFFQISLISCHYQNGLALASFARLVCFFQISLISCHFQNGLAFASFVRQVCFFQISHISCHHQNGLAFVTFGPLASLKYNNEYNYNHPFLPSLIVITMADVI